MKVRVLFDLDKCDKNCEEILFQHVISVYKSIPAPDKEWKDMDFTDLKSYNTKYGITPFLKFFLERVLYHGGKNTQGVLRVIYLLLIESAVQEKWKEDDPTNDEGRVICNHQSSMHEWLHFDAVLDSIKYTFDKVEEYWREDLQPSIAEFLGDKKMDEMNYEFDIASVSWPPKHTMKEEKLHVRPTDEEITKVVKELIQLEKVYNGEGDEVGTIDKDGIAVHLEESFGITGLTSRDIDTLVRGSDTDIATLMRDKLDELDEPVSEEGTIIHVTHILYDEWLKQRGSKELGLWKDPIKPKEGSTWGWDADKLDDEERKAGRDDIEQGIIATKKLHGPLEEAESRIIIKPIDVCIECFKNGGDSFEKMVVNRQDYQQVGSTFEGYTLYGYR